MILHNKENSLINYDWMMLQLNLSVLGSSGGEKEKRQMRYYLICDNILLCMFILLEMIEVISNYILAQK